MRAEWRTQQVRTLSPHFFKDQIQIQKVYFKSIGLLLLSRGKCAKFVGGQETLLFNRILITKDSWVISICVCGML